MTTFSKRTLLEKGICAQTGHAMHLVHRTAGEAVAGSGTVQVKEAWGVLFPDTRSGNWLPDELAARNRFNKYKV
jgi:hypothetical protein